MKIETSQITKVNLSEIDSLDPITVILENYDLGQGKIIIECYGESWASFWGGMGDRTIAKFFCECDEHYLANKLSGIDSEIYDIDAIMDAAEKKEVPCYQDDPWNDHEFMTQMYGPDMECWGDMLPKITNPKYRYLCRIIKAVQEGLGQLEVNKNAA